MKRLTGAHSLIRSLEANGVDVIFGVPGGAILPAYDPILDSPIRHVLARHEQGAGHMAEGYAMATGRPGVTVATSGPGATNLVTPLMNALMDSTPLVAVTGQVATRAIGTQAFQEAPTIDLTRSCTKANWFIEDPADIPEIVAEAFRVATSGRPGPVLVDIPKDVQAAETVWRSASHTPDPRPRVDRSLIQQRSALLAASERPVLYVGGGVIASGASAALLRLAEAATVPVVTTLMGRGAFPDHHPTGARDARHARHLLGHHRPPAGRPARRRRRAVRRSGHRRPRRLRPACHRHPHRHRPERAREDPNPRAADPRRRPARARSPRGRLG
jgi:acetolactate synthase I/II/III large subunit